MRWWKLRGGKQSDRPAGDTVEAKRRVASALVEQGLVAENAGDPHTAMRCFREATQADPQLAPAHLNLGIALQALGKLQEAIEAYSRAIALDPGSGAAHYNLGLVRLSLGNAALAEAEFRSALGHRAQFPEAWVGLAEALEALGRTADAMEALDQAIELRPDYVGALLSAGALARVTGSLAVAESRYRSALRLAPEAAEAQNDLGTILLALGRLSEAQASFARACELRPSLVEAHANLGSVAEAQGNFEQAVACFRQALGMQSHALDTRVDTEAGLRADLQAKLAWALRAAGRPEEALELLFDALAQCPEESQLRQTLAAVLQGVTLGGAGQKQRAILRAMCLDDRVSIQYLNTTIVGLIVGTPVFPELRDVALCGVEPYNLSNPEVAAFFLDSLLNAALPRLTIDDIGLESVLTHARRSILLSSRPGDNGDVAGHVFPAEFICALVRQCFYSGYAFFATEDELTRLKGLRAEIERRLSEASKHSVQIESLLSVAALFAPLHTLVESDLMMALPVSTWRETFRPIVREQIEDHRRERELRARIPAITPIQDHVSIAVRGQYEESPYPVWSSVQRADRGSFEALSRRLRPDSAIISPTDPLSILIAGCGTGHHPIQVALAHPHGQVLAVDLSLASLAYASRMAERFGVTNISFRQADILMLGQLERSFSLIESGGVLHHLHEPMQGWKVLVGLLAEHGLMKIAVYSKTARLGIEAARGYIRALALPPTPDGVRRARRALVVLPDGHPAKAALRFGDFYTLNGCRDLVMHVQEHAFTLSGLAECLDSLDLRFLEFECDLLTRKRFSTMFPQAEAAVDLQAWAQFELAYPDTFKGMYTFWCGKANHPVARE